MSEAAREALFFAAQRLVPALFPFAVLSRFLLLSGVFERSGRLLSPLARRLSLSNVSLPALLAGLFCGFPLGAFSAATLWESGQIDKEEACRLTAFGGNAGAAFLLATAGTLFQNRRAGLLLFLSQTTASLVAGLLLARRVKKKKPANSVPTLCAPTPKLLPLAADAIVKGGLAMLSVCAFVTFFAVILAALKEIPLLKPLLPFLSVLLEASGAVKSAAGMIGVWGCRASLTLAAFAVGFTGLSVFLQSESLFGGALSLSYLVKVRLFIAALTALITFWFFPLMIA